MARKTRFNGIRTYTQDKRDEKHKKSFSPHYMKIHELVDYFDTDVENGLSPNAVKKRSKDFGKNLLYPEFERSFKIAFIEHIKSVISALFAFSLFLFYIFENNSFYLFSAILVSLSVIVDCVFEHLSSGELIKVRKKATFKALVRRNNETNSINSRLIVPGDIVVLKKGSIVPADIRLFDSNGLSVLETPVTGSDIPVKKVAVEIFKELEHNETPINMAYAGSVVCEGRASGIVCFTGKNTKFASIPKNRHNNVPSLFRYVFSVSSMLSIVSSFVGFIILVFGLFFVSSFSENFIAALCITFCAMCDTLVSFSAIAFSSGLKEMKKEGAILRNLSAIEKLTFTNSLVVHQNSVFPIQKTEIDNVFLGIDDAGGTDYENILLRYYLLCSDYERRIEGKEVFYDGRKSVVAAALYADSLKIKFEKKSEELLVTEEFISENSEYGSVLAYENGQKYIFMKGLPEDIIPLCKYYESFRGRRTLSYNDLDNIENFVVNNVNETGYIIALAKCETNIDNLSEYDNSKMLTLCGFIKFKTYFGIDCLKDVSECFDNGIDITMFSSDTYLKAYNLGRNSGIFSRNSQVITEEEAEYMSEDEFDENVSKYKLFLNFPSSMFKKIVEYKKSNRGIVAITAESTNDLSAIKYSDVSFVIKGENSEMINQSSDVILNSGGFDVINRVFAISKKIYRKVHSICEYSVYNYVFVFLSYFLSLIFDIQIRIFDFLFASVILSGILLFYISITSMSSKDLKNLPQKRQKTVKISSFTVPLFLGVEGAVLNTFLCLICESSISSSVFLVFFALFSIFSAMTIINEGKAIYKSFIGINLRLVFTILVFVLLFVFLFFIAPILGFCILEIINYQCFIVIFFSSVLVFFVNPMFLKAINK